MTRILLGTIALMASHFDSGDAPEPSKVEQARVVTGIAREASALDDLSPKAAVQKALEVGKDDPAQALAILDTALKTSPNDREVLFLRGVISVSDGEKATDDKDKRISRFHKAFASLSDIKRTQKELNPAEKSFEARIELGEARALCLEGKPTEAFAIIKTLLTTGTGDLDSIEMVDDLRPLHDLPEFRAFVAASYGPKLAQGKQEVAAEMAALKPFAFDFKLKDLDDKTVSLADYRGKVTIVDLWGTWCPPCRKEIPHLVALAKQYKDQGLEVVGINCKEEGTDDEIKKTIRDFIKAYKIDYKCLLDDNVEERVPDLKGFPTTLFIDSAGQVRLVFFRGEPKVKLEAAVLTLLGEAPKAP